MNTDTTERLAAALERLASALDDDRIARERERDQDFAARWEAINAERCNHRARNQSGQVVECTYRRGHFGACSFGQQLYRHEDR